MMSFTESVVEDAALAWLESLGYAVLSGPAIAVGEPGAERGVGGSLTSSEMLPIVVYSSSPAPLEFP